MRLVEGADWNGGNMTVGVGVDGHWELEVAAIGVWFHSRRPHVKKAYFVPHAGVRFIETDTE